MPARNAGSAFVTIRPDATAFVRDLRRDLASYRDPGFSVRVEADTDSARREATRFRDVESSKGIDIDVDANTKGATAHIDTWRRDQEANRVEIKVDIDTKEASAQAAGLRRQLEGFGRSDFLRLNVGAFAIGGVQAAAGGLAQLAASLQQVSQAGLAVPGAIGGAAASIGTLVVGLAGVQDAYTAVSKAALSSGTDAAASARAAASAQTQLRNAVVDEVSARKDQANAYRDARQQLQDLNIEMRGGLVSESRAILEAQKAREDLARGNYSDVRDATLRVAEADQRLIEVRSRNAQTAEKLNDAQAKGVAGSDLVVAANERVVRSQQQVADAQAAVADAAGKQSAAQKAAAQAMDQLSPNARKFVQTLIDMKPEFDKFRDATQEPLFEGKAEEFQRFFSAVSPVLKTGMSGIATGWNQNITALLNAVSSSSGVGLLDRILGNTGEAQSRLSAAMKPLVDGLGTLTAAGSDALPRLADALGDVATKFSNFITEADQDGRLATWINEGISGMSSLSTSVLNIGKAFTGITKAAGGGGSFLKWLENITGRMETFLNSADGQTKLKEFFAEGLEQLQKWGDLLKSLPGAFKSLSDGAQPYLSSIIGLFTTLADFIGEHETLVKNAVIAYLTFKTVSPVISGVQSALGTLSTVVTNLGTNFYPMRDNAKKAMSEVDQVFTNAGKPNSGMGKFAGSLSALSGVGGAGLALLTAVGIPLVATFVEQFGKDMDDAKSHANSLNSEVETLINNLDAVTNLTGTAFRGALAQQFQTGQTQGSPENGLGGNALAAAAALNIGGPNQQDLITAALPGGDQQYDKIMGPLRDQVRPAVKDFIKNTMGGIPPGVDLTENDIVDAWLGVPAALAKVQKAKDSAGQNYVDFGQLYRGVSALGPDNPLFQASLVGQRLNFERSASGGAVQQAQAAQAAATPQPKLRPDFASQFPGAVVNSNGRDTTIVSTVPPDGMQLDPGTTVERGVPPNDDKWTYRLSPEDARKFTYAKGGPTPNFMGPVDGMGGHWAVVHPKEFMISARGRSRVPDSFLHALNQGLVDPRLLPHYDDGGEIPQPIYPPLTGPALTDPGLTPMISPNPTAGQGGPGSIINQVVGGLSGTLGNALSLAQAIPGMVNSAGGAGVDPNTTVHGTAAGAAPGPAAGGIIPGLTAAGTAAGSLADRAAQLPGLAGLIGSAFSSDPTSSLMSWGSNTLDYVANWGMNTLGRIGSTLWQGALGFFGLENSILSPSNIYNQAAQKTGQFFLDQNGPLGVLLGTANGGSGQKNMSTDGLVDPSSLASTYGVDTSGLMDPMSPEYLARTGGGAAAGANLSPSSLRAIQSAQRRATGQKYQYGGTGANGQYDCSGIVSAIYSDMTGRQVRFMTDSNFASYGFEPGFVPGALNIGTNGGHGANGHMALTLPNGVNVESSSSNGTNYGGPAMGAKNFPLQYHLAIPGMATGGPTPDGRGPVDALGGHYAVVHPDEFMISRRGRATVPDSFLHALNRGLVDPKELPSYAAGGPINTGVVFRPIPPVPPPPPSTQARHINPPTPARHINPPAARATPSSPSAATPATPAAPGPAAVTPVPTAAAPSAAASQPGIAASGAPTIMAANPGAAGLNHNVGWVNTLIDSSASNIGQLIATGLSIAGGAMGAAGVPGGGALSAAAPYAAGLAVQGGKIVEGIANVVSSSLVGNAPGSFGGPAGTDPNGTIIARTPAADIQAPAPGGGTVNQFNGISDVNRLMDRLELHDKVTAQATLAKFS